MKLIAKTKDGDIYEVKAQRMFPNCKARYTKCCFDDKAFWAKYQSRVKELDVDKDVYTKPRPAEMFNSPIKYIWDGK